MDLRPTTTSRETNMTAAKKKNNKKKLAASAAILLGAASALTVTSLAVFTDTEAVTTNSFATGTLDLTVGTNSALLTGTGMVPGDQVTAPLAVGNAAGSIPLRYAMTTTMAGGSDPTLSGELVLTVKTGVTCTDAAWATGGTILYAGPLNAGVIGNPAQGQQLGDRSLATNTSETLCFNVTLPLTATASGVSADATFTFDAEQTANNP